MADASFDVVVIGGGKEGRSLRAIPGRDGALDGVGLVRIGADEGGAVVDEACGGGQFLPGELLVPADDDAVGALGVQLVVVG